jgi:hypothetical protein
MTLAELLNKPIGELAILVGLAVGSVCVLLAAIAIVLDKLNVKRISIIPPRLEFYEDGELHRRPARRSKARKNAR